MQPTILSIFSDIGDSIEDFFYQVLWNLMSGILEIINAIQQAFYYVVGVNKLTFKGENGELIEESLLDRLFGTSFENGIFKIDLNNPVHKAFYGMMFLFIIILVFSIVCSIVKINMNRQDKEVLPSTSKMFWKSFQAMGIVIIIPIVFATLLAFVGLILGYFTSMLGENLLSSANSASISQCIFLANIDPTKYMDLVKKRQIKDVSFGMSYDSLKELIGRDNIKWVLLLLSEGCVIVGMAMCTLTVAERLINIILLYLVSPIVVATIPLDDGKRWENWKDITVAKVTTAGGNIISLYVYLYIITIFGTQIIGSGATASENFILSVVYLFITVGGSFVAAKGATIIASIISSNTGQQEGMSFMASQAMLKGGMKVAGAIAGGAFAAVGGKALMSKLKGGNSSGGSTKNNANNDASGTNGGNNGSGAFEPQGLKNNAEPLSSGAGDGPQNKNLGTGSSGGNGTFSKVNNALSSVGGAVSNGVGAVGQGAKKALGGLKNSLTVPGLLKNVGKAGALAVAGGAALAVGGAKVLRHPVSTVKKTGTAIASGAKKTGSALKTGANAVIKAPGVGVNHLKNTLGNLSSRNGTAFSNVKAGSLGTAIKNPEVKGSVKELNSANKATYKATQQEEKATKQFQKAQQKVNKLESKGVSGAKLHKAQETAHSANLNMANKKNATETAFQKSVSAEQKLNGNLIGTGGNSNSMHSMQNKINDIKGKKKKEQGDDK